MENSKIRRVILAEHEGLRGELRDLETGLDTLALADGPSQQVVHGKFKHLLESFLRHIEHEERILRPVLKDIDAWAAQRVAHMDAEHKEQRAQVLHLAGLFPQAAPDKWVAEVRAFVARLREDMAAEERDSLDPRLLRDDVIVIDGFTG
jgi:iron-sulfur cluster repair protein YtfE (RIC family)